MTRTTEAPGDTAKRSKGRRPVGPIGVGPSGDSVMLAAERLPQVLPTDRLLANGMARRDLRNDLRRIPNVRNAITVLSVWASAALLIGAAVWLGPLGYLAAFVLMVPIHVRLAILMHEAAHRLLFSNRRANDWVGRWLIASPAFVPISLYRPAHFAHHKEEFGPNEPDLAFYGGYPGPWADLRRRLLRDAGGISGWKNLRRLLRAAIVGPGRGISGPILAVQAMLWATLWLATGRWYVYPVLWLGPWLTGWPLVNRLRALGEHGGLGPSSDRRVTTHNVAQSWGARLWLVPYNTGWHLAHHVDMGIPWRNLPRFHAELERAGYITDEMTYPNYRALWRALCGLGTPIPARASAGGRIR
ncbi:MAG: fatty acid desaturase [Microthrixaceae bacterium]